MSRTFAPAAERLKSVIAREKTHPARVPIGARKSEKSAAHLHRGRARTVARHRQLLSKTTCPRLSRHVTDAALLADFRKANQAVIDALNAYEQFLKNDLLPRSQRRFPHRRRQLPQEAAL